MTITTLINTLPSVEEMKKHLSRRVKAGKVKPKLKDVKPEVTSAAWLILRWCVASCTAHIEPIESGPQLIRNLGNSYYLSSLSVLTFWYRFQLEAISTYSWSAGC